jgi:hypothetical protein
VLYCGNAGEYMGEVLSLASESESELVSEVSVRCKCCKRLVARGNVESNSADRGCGGGAGIVCCCQ